jgi:hypothetical protein
VILRNSGCKLRLQFGDVFQRDFPVAIQPASHRRTLPTDQSRKSAIWAIGRE